MRRGKRRLLLIAAVIGVPVLVIAVLRVRQDQRISRLSEALDRDLAALASQDPERPPLPGDPVFGTALEHYEEAFAAIPPEPPKWMEVFRDLQSKGTVNARALPYLEQVQAALALMERGARTRAAGVWIDPATGEARPGSKVHLLPHLAWLSALDATRLVDAGQTGPAVTRLLAGVRMAGDAGRSFNPRFGNTSIWRVLATLVRLGERLSDEDLRRALEGLSLELSIRTPPRLADLESLRLQCRFRRALAGVDQELFLYGHVDERDAIGDLSYRYQTRGIGGFYERKTCMVKVRRWVPDAWEFLRKQTAAGATSAANSRRFQLECKASENPAIVDIGYHLAFEWYQPEKTRVELEAAVLALLAILHRRTEGHLPGSLEELRPESVRPLPNGCRWFIRPHPKQDRTGIWLLPFQTDRPLLSF